MGSVSRGRSRHRPRNDARLFGGEYPFVQTADVKEANFYLTKYSQTYNEMGLAQSKLWDKGTLCITIAANIADTAILGIPACFPDSIMGFNAYPEIANTAFVKYCFDILQKDCKQISQGTAQDNLSWEKLSTIEFPCPPLEIQNRIASILSRYDDLIENYQHQIQLLEEAAQRLYKEWFVDLHFPGYENTNIVDGVPEGWEKKKANTIFDITIGKTPPRKEPQWFSTEKGIPWASISDMKNGTFITDTNEYLTPEAIERFNINVVPQDTILLSFKLTVGRVSITMKRISTNEAIAHFPIKDERLKEYAYLYLKGFNYDSLGNTSGISKAVNSTIVKNMPFVLPDSIVISQFHHLTKPIFDNIANLTSQIRLLTEARDRLLPKLMSGEITV